MGAGSQLVRSPLSKPPFAATLQVDEGGCVPVHVAGPVVIVTVVSETLGQAVVAVVEGSVTVMVVPEPLGHEGHVVAVAAGSVIVTVVPGTLGHVVPVAAGSVTVMVVPGTLGHVVDVMVTADAAGQVPVEWEVGTVCEYVMPPPVLVGLDVGTGDKLVVSRQPQALLSRGTNVVHAQFEK